MIFAKSTSPHCCSGFFENKNEWKKTTISTISSPVRLGVSAALFEVPNGKSASPSTLRCRIRSSSCRWTRKSVWTKIPSYWIRLVRNRKNIIWVFPKIVVPQNGWFIMENPIKNGWFGGTIIFGNTRIMIMIFMVIVVVYYDQYSPTVCKKYAQLSKKHPIISSGRAWKSIQHMSTTREKLELLRLLSHDLPGWWATA